MPLLLLTERNSHRFHAIGYLKRDRAEPDAPDLAPQLVRDTPLVRPTLVIVVPLVALSHE